MAQSEYLPIYKASFPRYEPCGLYSGPSDEPRSPRVASEGRVSRGRNFCPHHKLVLSSEQGERIEGYTLGADLRDGARCVLKLVVRANARRDKAQLLLQIREQLEELKVLLRLGHDTKVFPNFSSFEHAIGLVTNIARQTLRYALRATQGDRISDREQALLCVHAALC